MLAVAALAAHIGMKSACRAFALNRGWVYRDRARHCAVVPPCMLRARPRPPLALSSRSSPTPPAWSPSSIASCIVGCEECRTST
jgi:hypothetical protein